MKYRFLRNFMQYKRMIEDYTLENSKLVIDGNNYFYPMYKYSGCQFILGGEYDRYAEELRGKLKQFLNSKVMCYVIFNGGHRIDIQNGLIRNQMKIDKAKNIKPNEKNDFCDVLIYANDVAQQVLDQLGIKFFIAESNHREAIVTLAKYFSCPILTNNFELSLFGVDCIPAYSITYYEEVKSISCLIHKGKCNHIRVPDERISIFLTLADQDLPSFDNLHRVIDRYNENKIINDLLYWCNQKSKKEVLSILKKNLCRDDFDVFVQKLQYNDKIADAKNSLVIEYFESSDFKIQGSDWFERGIACGCIASSYINLTKDGIFHGSWLMADVSKKDAMLASIEVVMFAYALLVNTNKIKIKFIGREGEKSRCWEIENILVVNIPQKALFMTSELDFFTMFLDCSLPGLNLNYLRTFAPAEAWVIMISLIFYTKKNQEIIVLKLAYAVLLSYVIVGPVAARLGGIMEDVDFKEPAIGNLTSEDCVDASNALMSFFYLGNIEEKFDISILHCLSEFQHILQNINYLNTLVGERIPRTKYYESFNGTFIFNTINFMKDRDQPVTDVIDLLQNNSTVGSFYKTIVECFETCLKSVEKMG